MRTLVLGGAGFIGLHLARRLAGDGHEVCIVDDFSRGRHDRELAALTRRDNVSVVSADLTDPAQWENIGHGFDQVYLLAAIVGVRNVERDPARVIRVNTLAALHLLEWYRPGDGRVFFASTSEVYAGGVDAGLVAVPTGEDVPVMIADPGAPRFAYAVSKLLGEAAFLHAARAGTVPAVVGRFHNVYGPRMGADHVIPEMLLRALGGENPFTVYGADQYRAFCYIDDAVSAILALMACPDAVGQVVHIGDDTQATKIADLATLILDTCGQRPTTIAQPAPPGSVARRCPDLRRLRTLTGYQPATSLADGVATTMTWYRNTQHTLNDNPQRPPIAFYYGTGHLDLLTHYRKVVLQPDSYTPEDLSALRRAGTQPLAYLSLSEDTGPSAPWQRADTNPDWGGHYVRLDHPDWTRHILTQARTAIEQGFTGLFLDTLNVEHSHPEELPHLLALIEKLRDQSGNAYLLANRGFALLPTLAEHIDGILFESFTARWTDDGYQPWPADVLEHHATIAEQLAHHNIDRYALDYTDSEGLTNFAKRRAHQFGLQLFTSDRALSRL